MRKSVLLLSVLGLLFTGAGETFAQCACAPEYIDIAPHKELKLADAVFTGKVVEVRKSARDEGTGSYVETVKFEVRRAWKRDLEAFVTITNEIQGCANGFGENEEWLVYAYEQEDGILSTGCCCSRTRLLSEAAEDLKEFEAKGVQPTKVRRPQD
jgi:hypothetical protein